MPAGRHGGGHRAPHGRRWRRRDHGGGLAPDGARPAEAAPLPEATPPEPAATIHEALWRRAAAQPARPHVYLREDDGAESTITYAGLLADATAVAGGLRERGIRRGDAVALMLPTGREFLAAFQGILLARAVAVPIYPPLRLDRLDEYARRQSAILANAGVRALVTVGRAKGVAAVLRDGVPTLRDVVTVGELLAMGASWSAPEGEGADPAFVQYTSGSTGAPKGVLLTHDNLFANIRAIGAGLGVRPTDVGASWLPLYHDMGLIGTWLFCLQLGVPLALMSPLAFLARPERWLLAIHQRRATLSAAPNFAYELCARKVPDKVLDDLDLSSWRVALNGAEPVLPETLERFCRRFARCGFRREALLPVYGLAESSVALCFPPLERGPKVDRVRRAAFEEGRAQPAEEADATALRFVSVGTALPAHEVRLLDDAGGDAADRTVGRLVFRGPSTTPGYFDNPEATAAITLPGGWLDSGDLAYRAEGEIYVAGRRKDLIIKGGRNLVPHEIEEVAASVEGIRKGCVVAFGVARGDLGTESLVVVAETRARDPGQRDRLVAAVTEVVATAVGLPPDVVALVPPGAVPKTSSGKVRRAATKDLFEKGALGAAAGTSPVTRARVVLGAAWSAVVPRLALVPRTLYAAWLAGATAVVFTVAWIPIALVPGRRFAWRMSRLGARLFLRLAACPVSAEGLAHADHPGPLILASNHASYVDVIALAALLPREFAFVAKQEVLSSRVLGTLARRAEHVTVDRFEVTQSVADAGKVPRALEDGRTLLVFPEGTFVRAAGLRPFRLGAFKTAVETGTPIVPLALRGTRAVLRGDDRLPRPGPIHLWVGEPIAPEGDGWRAVVALRDRVAEAIAAHTGEPRLDLVAGGPVRP